MAKARVGAGTQDLRDLIKDLGKLPPDLRKELRMRLKATAQEPLAAVRASTATWSTRIPKATKISIKFGVRTAGVTLRVSRKQAPHARPINHGDTDGVFRHPIFGDRQGPWVTQAAHPFFARAAQPWLNKTDEAVGEVIDLVGARFRAAGFR